jgi:hypothetical protein
MTFNNNMLMAGATANAGGFSIPYAARFNSADSPGLSRAWSNGNRTTGTLSLLFQPSKFDSTTRELLTMGASSGVSNDYILFEHVGTSNIFQIYYYNSGVVWQKSFTQVLRDPSAYYHLCVTFDTTNGTAGDRVILYLNGSRVTAFGTSTNPTASANQPFNVSGGSMYVGKDPAAAGYWDGYVSQVCWIDGAALTPSSFGETDAYGNWIPKDLTALSASKGTNGCLLAFTNSAALGTDAWGGTTFTSSGLTSADQVTSTPTNVYSTFNPLIKNNTTGSIVLTYSDGNLRAVGSSANGTLMLYGTIPFSSGKYRMEATVTNLVEAVACGITPVNKVNTDPDADHLGNGICQYFAYTLDGKVYNNNVNVATNTASSLVDGELIACEVDLDTGEMEWFHKDSGVWTSRGTYSFTPSGDYVFGIQINDNGCDVSVNFGQQGFDGTPTAGFKTLCTSNLPAPAIKDGSAHFQSTLWTGNATNNRAITQTGNSTFSPGFVWIKNRNLVDSHFLVDVVRGASVKLNSNSTVAEGSTAGYFDSFDAAGFTIDSDTQVNGSGNGIVGWQWKAGGAGVSNTNGTITSTVSVNTTAGFSVVTYTGAGAAGTVGHGLGVTPAFIILKSRSNGAAGWYIWHQSVSGTDGNIQFDTAAKSTNAALWNTGHTSTTFGVGNYTGLSQNAATFVAYCFAEIPGYSRMGSYVGNGSADGPFIYTGFPPAFILTKNITTGGAGYDWVLQDTARSPYNMVEKALMPNLAEDENTAYDFDILSNGFKLRGDQSATNRSGNTLVYIAFAEHPFGGVGVSPATAR